MRGAQGACTMPPLIRESGPDADRVRTCLIHAIQTTPHPTHGQTDLEVYLQCLETITFWAQCGVSKEELERSEA